MRRGEGSQPQARRAGERPVKAAPAFRNALGGLASGSGRTRNGRPNGSGNGRARPSPYSALSLLRHGITHETWLRVWREHDLARSYDVVVVGAGVHGLATAYYLAARHSISNVA